ncbi:MAG: methyltransferase [Pseudomonadota bacterium]
MILKQTQSEETDETLQAIEEVTTDAFHNGAFKVLQPKGKGYRSGLDALLIAAALPEGSSGIIADLGSGSGVAGLAALNLNRDLDLMMIEKNPHLIKLASRSLALRGNETLKMRVRVLEADVCLSGIDRLKAGLDTESVDHVIMNPPFYDHTHRAPHDTMRTEAFVLGEGGIDAWFRTAAAMLRPGGSLTMVYRSEKLGEVLACTQGRFGELQILPIYAKDGEAAKRILVRGIRGSRGSLSILPGFVIHKVDGSFCNEAESIFNGEAFLDSFSK